MTLVVTLVFLIGTPAVLAWLISGGPFSWLHLLIGIGVAAALIALGGVVFGWALGRRLKDD